MKIDWKVFSDNELIIKDLNKIVKYEDNIIYYSDEYGLHKIDLDKKVYERNNTDNIFKIDFNTEILTIKFDNNDLKYNINTNYEDDGTVIKLTYSLGDENKVIEVTRKEEL